VVILKEEDRQKIDGVFHNLNEVINRRRDIVAELRKIVRNGEQFLRIPGYGLMRVEDGTYVGANQRTAFMREYLNIGDYLGYITELTYILKSIGGMTKNVKDAILEIKLVDNNSIIDTFMKTGDLGRTITVMTQNISELNNRFTRLRRVIFGR